MQRSSESIASLAAALAKAQAELVNPEKSLVGTIEGNDSGTARRSFRYAPLASGLDIVRKTLGQHEIATVQTTAIDHGAGIINLTTVLAHASGEWIASDWPVCPISETATPHRMGAALTYARRYALFTLVGIAGEDDLDAPDLMSRANQISMTGESKADGAGRLNGGEVNSAQRRSPRRNGRGRSHSAKPILGAARSAELRDRLLGEIGDLGSADAAAIWAQRSLPAKNGLTTDDAQRVEEAFAARLAAFAPHPAEGPATSEDAAADRPQMAHVADPGTTEKRLRSKGIDKSNLSLPEPRRVRDRDHVQHVAKQPCLICGRRPSDAHHLRFAQSRALGLKVSDEFTVPLCRGHHRELHRRGDEADWWRKAGIDPTIQARALWLQTHPLPHVSNKAAMEDGGERHRSSSERGTDRKTKPITTA